MGITLTVDAPRNTYMHGWGTKCSDAKPIRGFWKITIMDVERYPVTFEFDLVEGWSPLIIGLDAAQYANTCNRTDPTTFSIKRPQDRRVYTLHTYTARDQQNSNRLRLQVVPRSNTQIRAMVTTTGSNRELNMAKRIHRFGHASAKDMEDLMRPMKFDQGKVREVCEKGQSACPICVTTGRPIDRKKISTSHIHSAFNQDIQADYLYVTIHGKKHKILNIFDTGTKYGERTIASSRTADDMKERFEKMWFYHHGAPSNFSADHEFCRPILRRFLTRHSITIHPRPSRSSNKTGIVERNNGVLRTVIDKMQKADTNGTPEIILARASFITNLLRGSKVMSAFQMARGYMPSILGIPRDIVTNDLLEAHIERESIRALERIMKSKSSDDTPNTQLTPGTKVMVFHKSTKHSEPNMWIPATVLRAEEHIVTCRRSKKGPPMNISHNDLRIMPSGDLTEQLMRYECSDDLSDKERITNNNHTTDTDTDYIYKENEEAGHDEQRRPGVRTERDVSNPNPTDGTRDMTDVSLFPSDGNRGVATDAIDTDERMEREIDGRDIPKDGAMIAIIGGVDDKNDEHNENPRKGVMTITDDGRNMTRMPTDGMPTTPSPEDQTQGSHKDAIAYVGRMIDTTPNTGRERKMKWREGNYQSKATKDIGDTEVMSTEATGDLRTDIQKVLRRIHSAIGNSQVTITRMQSAPSWLTHKALTEEHNNNWATAYEEISEKDIPEGANVISSHVVYKIKTDEKGEHRLKARICPHGNKDAMKDGIRKDSATAQFNVIRMMLAMTTFFYATGSNRR